MKMSYRPGTVPHMGRKALFDHDAMADLLVRQSGVITRSQVQDCAMSDQALRSIIIAGRPDIGQPDWRNARQDVRKNGPLTAQDVTDIVAYLRTLRSPTPGQPYPQNR